MILRKPRLHMWLGWGALALVAGSALAQSEAVLIKRAAPLRDAPGEASRTLAALPLLSSVTRLGERLGPWIKVRTADGTQGWVHMFDVTAPNSVQAGGAGTGALRSITGFFNKGSAQANAGSLPTSTVGIRGLGAEDLANSQPNLAAVAQADAGRVDAGQARQFASTAALSSRNVSPLPVPAAPARSTAPSGPAGDGNAQFQSGG
ncbi:MAG: hypothetical protein JWQ72_1495 [Polaromonas sp.]|nr:hypothetical protein [Polaromonas sp.]